MFSVKLPSAERLLAAIKGLEPDGIKLMEVCGTHTMSIARSGIKSLLPDGITLLSGPGCPVCVTPAEVIDSVLALSEENGIVIATYGDMVRVPGSIPGDSLRRRSALGAGVHIVYSPVDAVELAKQMPEKQVVFLGVGFETTVPGTAAAVLTAQDEGISNFSVWSMLKTVEPALRALSRSDGFDVDGFICPGHVGSIIGENGFRFIPEELGLPAVISGFEPEDILLSIYMLLRRTAANEAKLENEYTRAVSRGGNKPALGMIERCFEPREDIWRGLGSIEGSGLCFKAEFSEFDAEKRFGISHNPSPVPTACRCGDVITGRLSPELCPLFGGRCTPEDPVGPCMVSSEGACAAAYKYQKI